MTHHGPEDPLAALWQEIRRVGEEISGRTRRRTWRALGGAIGGMVLAQLVVAVLSYPSSPPSVLSGIISGVFGGVIVPAGLWLSAIRERECRRRAVEMRERAQLIDREHLGPLLRSIANVKNGEEGTRALALALLRDLNLSTELTPAGTPEGSGAEVSGVG